MIKISAHRIGTSS
ncbi:MAG: hypothetical protein MGAcid_15050 [uncultured Acidilobus sp. MG]|nr:MAG: hypothetical protein MGAcid_15050 [uncultured Acidilobus sp. MG]